MPIIKCKMCGGDMELSADKTFGTCDYCGSTMTLPKVDDDQRAAAFNRGNHFRRIGEFDKALAVYERIVAEDDTDAEAHWCCALCRFGIEYVEDPNTYEYLPTCHRASFDSFLEDVDYLAAVEHSDGITKRQYQKEAVKIAEVQKGILATSQNEEPFDVFICYKETDDATKERTHDSIDAQEIYYQLTQAGYRVFFSRITLEDKAGAEYEPYIFAALNSAKVMVAVGSKPEYYNAVWVKNEWSRFLALMRKDRSKLLLPCYKDMDPYDMPEQLSVLQSYDMTKIGFMQDLIRGIKKVLDAEKKPEPVKETVVVQQSSESNALLRRAQLYLEEKNRDKVLEYCEQVLDADPENSLAYFTKELAQKKSTTVDQLAEAYYLYHLEESMALKYARRFADEKTKAILEEFDLQIANYSHIMEKKNAERNSDPAAQRIRQKLKAVRETADLVESRVIAGLHATYVLQENGTIIGTEVLDDKYGVYDDGRSEAKKWRNIESTCSYVWSLYGITYDGRVYATRSQSASRVKENNEQILIELEKWTDIKTITEGVGIYYGIKKDGTVVCAGEAGEKFRREGQTEVSALADVSELVGFIGFHPLFLRNDGTLASTIDGFDDGTTGWDELSTWTDIVKVFGLKGRYVGLKKDGTLVATRYLGEGNDDSRWHEICNWTDIVLLYTTEKSVIALDEYGEILSTSSFSDTEEDQLLEEVSMWGNIAKLYPKNGIIYGLTVDGTLLATKYTGKQEYYGGEDAVRGMHDVAGFVPAFKRNVVIKKDGSLIAKGENDHGQCNVSGLKICDDIDTMVSTIKKRKEEEKVRYIEQARIAREAAEKRAKAARQKAAYDAACQEIENQIQAELSVQQEPIDARYRGELNNIQRQIDDEIADNQRNRGSIENEISVLRKQQASLGFFKGKEKKALQDNIDVLQGRLFAIASDSLVKGKYQQQIDQLNRDKQQEINRVSAEIRSKYTMPQLEDFAEE